MTHFPVEKEYYEKIPLTGAPSPTLNKYAEECQKQHMPKSVKVLAKKCLLPAIEHSLAQGGDVSKNEPVLKMCEEIDVSKLNESNFCCISHRWCSSDVSIDDFVDTFSQFLLQSYLCAEDVCFEERVFVDNSLHWWSFMTQLVKLVFPENGEDEEKPRRFLRYLVPRTALLGFVDTRQSPEFDLDEVEDFADIFTGLMMAAAVLQKDMEPVTSNIITVDVIEKIKRYLMFCVPQGTIPKITESDVTEMMKHVKSLKLKFEYSNPAKLYEQISEAIHKSLELVRGNKKLQENVFKHRFDESVKLIRQMKDIKNRGKGFNGQDPIALATLFMLQKSSFEYFWVDVFCTPQRKEDIAETLKAVKDGMAVFSVATVIISPPFLMEKLLEHSRNPIAIQLNEEKVEAKHVEYIKKFPILTINEKCLLFSDASYHDRMWTLHEMGIGKRLFYWWQYLFGPFHKPPSGPKKALTFKIDSMYNSNYKSGLEQTGFDTSMSRSVAVSTLRQYGPGDGLSTMFQTNFSTMQTGFAMDWELLATSIFKLDKDRDISEQILCKKMTYYQSYLLQYSPPGAKYSYAWIKNPEHVNHCFKFNPKRELVAGCVEDPQKCKPAPTQLKILNGQGKIGNEVVLTNCSVYQIKELTYEGFFSPSQQHVLYYLIGPRKEDLEKKPSTGYAIIADWKLPKFLDDARKAAVKIIKDNIPKNQDDNMKKSYKMMFDYLTPIQKVLIVKSGNKNHDFTVVYGIIPHQATQFQVTQIHNEKTAGNKQIQKLNITMN